MIERNGLHHSRSDYSYELDFAVPSQGALSMEHTRKSSDPKHQLTDLRCYDG